MKKRNIRIYISGKCLECFEYWNLVLMNNDFQCLAISFWTAISYKKGIFMQLIFSCCKSRHTFIYGYWQNEQRELERIINTETANLEAHTQVISKEIMEKAANTAFSNHVPTSFSQLACSNKILAQEIIKHQEVSI